VRIPTRAEQLFDAMKEEAIKEEAIKEEAIKEEAIKEEAIKDRQCAEINRQKIEGEIPLSGKA
jgi:hypothetical protein